MFKPEKMKLYACEDKYNLDAFMTVSFFLTPIIILVKMWNKEMFGDGWDGLGWRWTGYL